MSEVKKCKCEFCLNSFDKKVMVGKLCNNCHSTTKVCCECKDRFNKDEINSNGTCDDCDERELCEGDCGEKFDKNELHKGKCASCNEVSMDPLTDLCEIGDCENTSYIQYKGLSHCRNCYDISDD